VPKFIRREQELRKQQREERNKRLQIHNLQKDQGAVVLSQRNRFDFDQIQSGHDKGKKKEKERHAERKKR